jgi:hypothetical protein
MKKYNIAIALATFAFFAALRAANAAPCSAINASLINGNFAVVHTALSTKKPLSMMSVYATNLPTSTKRMLGDGAPFTLHNVYNVSNLQFAATATADEIRLLEQIHQIGIVSQPANPDLCFLVWFSGDNQLLDVNVILSQNGAGDMNLGSFNKLDSNLYMTLTRQGSSRR